jgi:hypothetical protein
MGVYKVALLALLLLFLPFWLQLQKLASSTSTVVHAVMSEMTIDVFEALMLESQVQI